MEEEPYRYEPHPSNAPGLFYVVNGACISCAAPEEEAPDLISGDDGTPGGFYHCHFRRQPRTPEELERAISAVLVSCCRGVRYKGRDLEVLKRLRESRCADQADALPESIVKRDSPQWPGL